MELKAVIYANVLMFRVGNFLSVISSLFILVEKRRK